VACAGLCAGVGCFASAWKTGRSLDGGACRQRAVGQHGITASGAAGQGLLVTGNFANQGTITISGATTPGIGLRAVQFTNSGTVAIMGSSLAYIFANSFWNAGLLDLSELALNFRG
jgi:hypothetical protein